ANAAGSATVTVQLQDNGGVANGGVDTSAAQTFVINVTAVNDAPSFVKGANQSVLVNSGLKTVAGWATAMSAGPADEAGQTLTFQISNNNTGLFSGQPAVASNGTLTFTPAANQTGTATVTVAVQDNGGGANNTSASQTFTISVVQGTTATSVATSNTPSLFKVPITLTATVTPYPAGSLAGGVVTFKDGAATLGTAALGASNVATLTTSTLAVGTHSITAVLAGSSSYLGSTSSAISQVISPSANLSVQFIVHALQDETNHPRVREVAVAGAEVRVYRKRDVCPSGVIVSGQTKMWGKIFDGLDGYNSPDFNNHVDTDPGCQPLKVGTYAAVGITDANGKVNIIVPPASQHPDTDYVVIGRTLDFDAQRTTPGIDPLYSEKTLEVVKAGTAKQVLLHQIRLFNGKQVPGRDLEELGTYLAVIEPEYMDWTADQELYPFVFISDGDWGVTTSVTPPDGFVPDYPELATSVNDAITNPVTSIDGFAAEYPVLAPTDEGTTAVQFTLTDVGSDWTSTKVTYTITHKGETRIRTSEVAMYDHKPAQASKVGLGASTMKALFGIPVTLTANVTTEELGHGLPGGTVTFKDGDTVLGSSVMTHASNGEVTFTATALSVGKHVITAVYEGAGSFQPATSGSVAVTIAPSVALNVRMLVHEVRDTTSAPVVTETVAANAEVRVYARAAACADAALAQRGQSGAWGNVFDGADGAGGPAEGCEVLGLGDYRAVGVTDANGEVRIVVPATSSGANGGYVVIARTMNTDAGTAASGGVLYSESTVSAAAANSGEPLVLLHQIRLANGTLVPGTTLDLNDRGLAIVGPEYMEWSGGEEHYPFILTAAGAWGVTTTVDVPAGIVSDHSAISTRLDDSTTAVQFTLTGSGDWTSTKITHRVTHDGQVSVLESRVPVQDKRGNPRKE
ncbi:MAG: Ig-like domain repeat protein, partial [Vicinamibacterales bacterium]